MNDSKEKVNIHVDENGKAAHRIREEDEKPDLASGTCNYCLEELAYTRSGDKGDNCNIGKSRTMYNECY